MNRKDTIIIAVLINTALLVGLFFSAVKPEKSVAIAKAPAPKVQKVKAEPAAKPVQKAPQQTVAKKAPPKKEEVKKQVTVPVDQTVAKYQEALKKQEQKRQITVAKGDNLDKLAKQHNVTVQDLMQENQLTTSRLSIGQVLTVPKANPQSKPKPKQVVEKKSEAVYYVVKGGDNPWTIAQKNHMQVDELLRLNNMNEQKAKRLRVGDKLRIK